MDKILQTLIAFFLIISVSGCGLFGTTRDYRNVPVPIYVVPSPPTIERPHLPIYDLSVVDKEDTDKVIRAYLVSFRLLLAYAEAQEEIIRTYRNLATRTDDSLFESIFTMSASSRDDTQLEVTELERRRMIARGMQTREDANVKFRSIVNNYEEKISIIWGEYETQDD